MIEITNILDVEKCLNGIKAAVFDLDDTLYSEKEYVKSGFKAIAAEFSQIDDLYEKLLFAFEKGKQAIDEVLKAENIYSEENKKRCLNIYRNHIPQINLYSGVREMLEKTKRKGLKLGIITDGRPEGQRAKIGALNICDLFDEIIITDELGGIQYRKPNPEAFKKMGEVLDASYKEMIYIGDNANKDFMAPQKMGMKCVWFKNQDGIYSELPVNKGLWIHYNEQ